MDKTNLYHWLVLYYTPRLGMAKLHLFQKQGINACSLPHLEHDVLLRHGLSELIIQALHHPPRKKIERDLAWAEQDKNHILHFEDPNYPQTLREIHSPPLVLFAQGNLALLGQHQMAVVGSRRPTAAGLRNTVEITRELCHHQLIITSGMAIGIDGCAHQTALEHDTPTIAVIATGPDLIYPRRHTALARRIAEEGLIVSEFSCGVAPKPNHFPRRNRIISALSLGVLVIEAGEKSGSLITAHYACEQNREVFAIPGSIKNPMVRGCHKLIQEGAKLVQSADDIIAELDILAPVKIDQRTQGHTTHAPLNPKQSALLALMDYDLPVSVNTLIEDSGLVVGEVLSLLAVLELQGYINVQNCICTRLL
ncbi:MAG: DNA-processing protein DprA [Candidatus Oxydemutatoraceae bacterium WSBS_2016_MAG_OTU14]